MATKNLARTPLEAGNTGEYRAVRRRQRRRHRHEAKVYCNRIARDIAYFDEVVAPIAPEHRDREGVWLSDMHADTIGPVRRWIEAQVGKRWDDVYSDIRDRFNTRTLAGRHIVDGHLLGYVDVHGDRTYCDLVVDDDGVLRCRPQPSWRRRYSVDRSSVSSEELTQWLAGRKVGRRGTRLYWFVSSNGTQAVWRVRQFPVERTGIFPRYETRRVQEFVTAYRQGRPLADDEVAFYNRLSGFQRADAAADLMLDAA